MHPCSCSSLSSIFFVSLVNSVPETPRSRDTSLVVLSTVPTYHGFLHSSTSGEEAGHELNEIQSMTNQLGSIWDIRYELVTRRTLNRNRSTRRLRPSLPRMLPYCACVPAVASCPAPQVYLKVLRRTRFRLHPTNAVSNVDLGFLVVPSTCVCSTWRNFDPETAGESPKGAHSLC